MNRLHQKTALVTGASRGIGKAIALALARQGATVIIHYAHQEAEAKATALEIKEQGGHAFIAHANLADMNAPDHLFSQVDAILGDRKLDILVNNAGILTRSGLDTITEEQFDMLFAINVKAPFFLAARALTRLNDGGRIINISSQVSMRPRFEVGAYAMTKAAIDNFTKSLASKLGERNITVNAVAPGITDTDMNLDKLKNNEVRVAIAEKIALKRIGMPEDIAHVVSFLASDAAGWITGQCLEASGGAGLIHS